jgi:RNA polymerase sigma factor (sigma-70 family)
VWVSDEGDDVNQTVFVVDDDEAVRDAMKTLLRAIDLQVETFASAAGFLNSYRPHQAGCILLDVRMPGTSGLALQDQLRSRHISLPVVFLTWHADVPMAVLAMKQGAFDFIEKPIAAHRLVPVITTALEFDRQQRMRLSHDGNSQSQVTELLATLSSREREVLDLVMDGRPTREIAEKLNVSIKTVEFHRARIREKLGVSSSAELFKLIAAVRP